MGGTGLVAAAPPVVDDSPPLAGVVAGTELVPPGGKVRVGGARLASAELLEVGAAADVERGAKGLLSPVALSDDVGGTRLMPAWLFEVVSGCNGAAGNFVLPVAALPDVVGAKVVGLCALTVVRIGIGAFETLASGVAAFGCTASSTILIQS